MEHHDGFWHTINLETETVFKDQYEHKFQIKGYLCREYFTFIEASHFTHLMLPILVILINIVLLKFAHVGVHWIGFDSKTTFVR